MAGDELHAPLGQDRPNPRQPKRRLPLAPMAYGTCAAIVAGLGLFIAMKADPRGGEPYAVAKIEKITKPETPRANQTDPRGDVTGTVNGDKRIASAAEIESQSGVKVTRQGSATPGALIIQVPQALGVQLTPAPDRRLIEKTRHGIVPRIGADGARPSDVYARPVVSGGSVKPGAPRIVLIVSGLGLNATVTDQAIGSLPGAVTLAFAPIGHEPDRAAAKAREQGHEILLQVPMEPFDYPQNNPGPHTLLSTAAPAQNHDDLMWAMSRFSGYTGVMNFLGAKVTSNEAVLAPVIKEIASRGLLFIDDGTSNQSQFQTLAPRHNLPPLKVDVVLDNAQRPDQFEAALVKLDTNARTKGLVIGAITAMPGNLDKIARFARALEGRGIALVPLSAAATAFAPSARRAP